MLLNKNVCLPGPALEVLTFGALLPEWLPADAGLSQPENPGQLLADLHFPAGDLYLHLVGHNLLEPNQHGCLADQLVGQPLCDQMVAH